MAGGSLAPGLAGPSPNRRKRKAPAAAAGGDEAEPAEEEIEELEREVSDLDRRILEHRRGTATSLLDAAVARLASLRPPARPEFPTVSEASIAEDDKEMLEKLKVLNAKIEANSAAFLKVLERVNESTARCEKLENLNVNIHPVFRRKW